MIDYKKYVLDNGLTLLVSENVNTPLVSVATLYDVGSRDETPSRTGFAHLFEHLMFGGTSHVPDYDRVVTDIGGESNAMTNNDFTQYYLTVPARFLETALWLESDRMRQLDLSARSLAVQQSVVTEEYNYRYINKPYGDVWLLLRPLCYREHPYRWCTIGADIRHLQEATLVDVEQFFALHYRPDNAILAVAGNVNADEVARLVEKWYGDIRPATGRYLRQLPTEPRQEAARGQSVRRHVPADALYMCYHTTDRLGADFCATDLVSDLLSNGQSSRLYNELVKHQKLFSEIDAYITGDRDPGLFVVSGKLIEGVGFDQAQKAVVDELWRLSAETLQDKELEKVVNKYESTFVYSQYKSLDVAMGLCYYQWLGHLEWINNEPALYREVSPDDIRRVAAELFRPGNLSTLRVEKIVD